jgi:hypothetical protein
MGIAQRQIHHLQHENAKRMIALEDFRYTKRASWWPFTTIIDVADYQVGWIFSMWPITIFKLKTSKLMDTPKYVTIIKIFGLEFQKT